jgi:hypothetical protein
VARHFAAAVATVNARDGAGGHRTTDHVDEERGGASDGRRIAFDDANGLSN